MLDNGAIHMPANQQSGVLRQLRKVAILPDGGAMTDGQLLECFVIRRDEAAFAALVRRHGPMVLGVCRRVLRNADDAEDAFQATFLVLVRKAASISHRELLAKWLYGVAYRTALDARAAMTRRRARERQVSEMPDSKAIDAANLCPDLRPLLDRELNRLPDKYRVPVILCDIQGRTRRAAARQLGVPEGTLSGRLTTARRMLAKRLTCQGMALSGGALAAALSPRAASACVPSPLVVSTVQAALAVAAGHAAAEVVSAKVAALTERMVKSMFVTNLKIATALVLVLGIVVGGGALAHQHLAADPPAVSVGKKSFSQQKDREARDTGAPTILKLDGSGRRVAWSPDGKTLAVVTKYSQGSAVKLWDVEQGKMRDTLAESTEKGLAFQQVVFSADGKTVAATVSEGILKDVIKMWDAQTLALKRTLDPQESQLVCVALSPDGKQVAAGDPHNKTVKLWNAETGMLVRTLETGAAAPWSVAFSPDSKTLLVGGQKGGGSGEVTLWNLETGKVKHTLKRENFVTTAAFSPNGKWIASGGGGGEIGLWDVQKGERILSLLGHELGTRCVAFSPDSKAVAAGGADGKVRMWDAQTGKATKTLQGHESEIYSLAFSPDGKTLASISQDRTIRLWNVGKRAVDK